MSARAHLTLWGIPVRVEPFFFVVIVLFGLQLERLDLIAVWVGVALVSVLVHELGHALALKAFGIPSAIVLHGFGGVTLSNRQLSRVRSIVVSVAGSLTALVVLWLPARTVWGTAWELEQPELLRAAILFTAFVNLWWSLANLLPIRPLDGGNVASELIGASGARRLSIATAAVGGVFAYSQGQTYAALFAALLAFLNLSEIRAERRGARGAAFEVDAPEVPPRHARPSDRRGRRRAGGRAGRSLRSVPPPPPGPTPAGLAGAPPAPDPDRLQAAAWAALRAGDDRKARTLLERLRGQRVNPFLPAAVAMASGSTDLAVDLYAKAYRAEPGGPPGLVATELVGRSGAAAPLASRLVGEGPWGIAAAGTLQTHLHYAGRERDAAAVGELVHAAGPPSPAQCAFEVACSWSRAGETDRALGWLEQAADDGFRAARLVDGEPDLAPLRADPRWPVVRARLA
jgi:stage IV sporulation protein FB